MDCEHDWVAVPEFAIYITENGITRAIYPARCNKCGLWEEDISTVKAKAQGGN